ncbi:GNAT family N-acetyltransferase [Caenimonas koreensis]|uniref:GNAT family N-acetyltransferase n=1 Tax=Caenimonas koreensis DSM 17982 TaxID=1121255 RepID=A0A844B7B7_9BURK|nr:GNAT family N-acetyltransferase [Caenimonas koreensis]MRD47549.1 GNAT family N-acetyltransferase [Caenimonas koreensis DSM 17982]
MTDIDPILIDLPASIDTARLHMRPPQPGDGAALHAALVESLAELRRFLGSLPWVEREQTLESAELWCRTANANFLTRKDLPFLLIEKASGDIVGASGLHRTVWTTPKTEVGYWGRTSRNGQGFVTEGVMALCQYAFEHIRAVRIELVTDEENTSSRKVAQRCGFTLEATQRFERRDPAGTLRNTCRYARWPTTG